MEVKEAARIAKKYVLDVFGEEINGGISLEEIDSADEQFRKVWKITVSFSREWAAPSALRTMASAVGGVPVKLTYKVVTVDSSTGSVISVKHRSLDQADAPE